MAVTVEGRAATEAYRRLNARLAVLTVAQMRQLWRLLDVDDIDGTVQGWLNAALPAIRQQRSISVGLSERYLRRFRIAEVGQPLTGAVPPPRFSERAVRTSLLVTGPYRIRGLLGKGGSLEGAARAAFKASAAAATRHVLNGGRDLLLDAVSSDEVALGWVRVTDGNPCAFCALLASRGPVFKSAASGGFQAHDACGCTAEPVYSRDTQWPGRAREWADLYADAARGQRDPLNAFRRAYEGTAA